VETEGGKGSRCVRSVQTKDDGKEAERVPERRRLYSTVTLLARLRGKLGRSDEGEGR
jgi:hypothetical protein